MEYSKYVSILLYFLVNVNSKIKFYINFIFYFLVFLLKTSKAANKLSLLAAFLKSSYLNAAYIYISAGLFKL